MSEQTTEISGRGSFCFRPSEAAVFLGIDRTTIDAELKMWRVSRGRRGLAHSRVGSGYMIMREQIEDWMRRGSTEVCA